MDNNALGLAILSTQMLLNDVVIALLRAGILERESLIRHCEQIVESHRQNGMVGASFQAYDTLLLLIRDEHLWKKKGLTLVARSDEDTD
jgi:hypothetical protein